MGPPFAFVFPDRPGDARKAVPRRAAERAEERSTLQKEEQKEKIEAFLPSPLAGEGLGVVLTGHIGYRINRAHG
jgi:hypothetical protein